MNRLLSMSFKPYRFLELARRSVLPKLPVAILLACFWLPLRAQTDAPQSLPQITLHIGKAALETEIASTPAEDERCLLYTSRCV